MKDMEKNDTIDGTISRINSELNDMYAAILLYDDLKHDSFNRLLTRIEQAIEDEQSAWKETATPTAAAALSEARRHLLRASAAVERTREAKAEPEASDRNTESHEIGAALERLVG